MLERLYPIGEPPKNIIPILEPSLYPTEKAEFALTKKQRLAILDRDGNRCQATVPHGHDEKHPLECDHLIPQRYAQRLNPPIDVDFPENILTKCRNAHDLRHKDRIGARQEWHEKGNGAFQKMFDERREKLDNKEIYWDPSHDRQDITRAVQLTQAAKKRGWVWPERRKKSS